MLLRQERVNDKNVCFHRYFGNYVKVFAKNGDNYEAVRDTIIGEGGEFGWSVDM